MALENIPLREVTQTQAEKHCISPRYEDPNLSCVLCFCKQGANVTNSRCSMAFRKQTKEGSC